MGGQEKQSEREVTITPSENDKESDAASGKGNVGGRAQSTGDPGRTPGKAEGVEDPEEQGNR